MPQIAQMSFDDVVHAIRSRRCRFGSESQLQDDVAAALTAVWIAHEREVRLGPKDRIDFLCAGGTGIECKVEGGPSAVLGQLVRYSVYELVTGLILVTSRRTHRFRATEIGGIPFRVIWVAGNL